MVKVSLKILQIVILFKNISTNISRTYLTTLYFSILGGYRHPGYQNIPWQPMPPTAYGPPIPPRGPSFPSLGARLLYGSPLRQRWGPPPGYY